MSDYKYVCITDVCSSIFAGGDAPKSNFSHELTEECCYPIFSNGESNSGLYGYTNTARVTEPSITVSARGTIGYTAIRLTPFTPIVRLISITPIQSVIDIDYLYYALTNYNPKNTGTSIPQLTVPMIKEYKFKLPERAEQKRAVKALKQLDSILEKEKKQIQKLDTLVKSRFVEMFGDPILNQKGFPVFKLGELVHFQGGSQPDKKYFEYEPTKDNIRLIQIRDYKTDKYITYIPKSMAKRFCLADDIMIGRYGPPIFQILQGIEGSYNVALMKAIPQIGNKEFVRHFLKQECLLRYLESMSSRTAGQDGIQMDKLKDFPFPYPPSELQDKFADFVAQIDKSKLAVQKSLEKLETLKKSLMQEYFG